LKTRRKKARRSLKKLKANVRRTKTKLQELKLKRTTSYLRKGKNLEAYSKRLLTLLNIIRVWETNTKKS